MVIVHRYVRWSEGEIFPPAKIASHQAIQGLEDSAWTSLTINMSAMTSSGWTGLVIRLTNRWPQRLTGCSTGNCGLRQDARNHWEQDRKAHQKQVWSRHLARFHMISHDFTTNLLRVHHLAGCKQELCRKKERFGWRWTAYNYEELFGYSGGCPVNRMDTG